MSKTCIKLRISQIFFMLFWEIFGSNKKQINEKTKKNPLNPYALANISVIYSKYE